MISDIVIIGSGPAGYTAAIYAVRAALSVKLISGDQPGGQLMVTTDVENYPGFAHTIQGPWLMEQMKLQSENLGVNIAQDNISFVDFSQRPFKLLGSSGQIHEARSVIIATGAQARWLDIPSETKYRGYGVSGCATCDGMFYKNQKVFVIGGGNTAVEEALYLTNHAAHVTLVHRRDQLRAEKILQNRLMSHPKVSMIWDSVVEEIIGTDKPLSVTSLRLKNVKTGAITEHPADGVFIAIGHNPNTALFKDHINIDKEGYIITEPDSTKTNIPGIFAAGDVKDKVFRQAVTSAGMGCMAALESNKFLAENE